VLAAHTLAAFGYLERPTRVAHWSFAWAFSCRVTRSTARALLQMRGRTPAALLCTSPLTETPVTRCRPTTSRQRTRAVLLRRVVEESAFSDALLAVWTRRAVSSFELTNDEMPYTNVVAKEIEDHWGHERMPPEVANIVVPDVATSVRGLGEATLFDCLMSDDSDVSVSRPEAASFPIN
jgi:hypothetical protein